MKVTHDENNIRYTLASSNDIENLSWLFIPGGPGIDSSYFNRIVEQLNLPGKTWLINLPGNGSNNLREYNFDNWLSIFVPMLEKFENPVVVGHSFGAMITLLFKEFVREVKL